MSVNFWNFELSGTSAVDFWETGTSIDGTIPGLSRMTPEQLKKKLDIEAGTGTSTSGSNIDYNEVNLMITSAVNNSVVSAMSSIPSTVSAAVSALPKNYKEYIDLRPDMYFDELVSAYIDGKGIKYTISEPDEPPETHYYNLQMKRLWDYNERQYAIFVVPENNTNMLPTEYMVLVPDYDSYDDDVQILAENNEQNESNNETRPLIKELVEFSEYPALNYNFPNNWGNQDNWYYTYNVLDVINDTEISNLFNFLEHCKDYNIDAYLTVNFGYINYYTRIPKLKVDLNSVYNNSNSKTIYEMNGEDGEYYYHMNLSKTTNYGLEMGAYALNKNIYFDFGNNIYNGRYDMREISRLFTLVVDCYHDYDTNEQAVASVTNDLLLEYFLELIWDRPEKVMITGGRYYSRNYKFEKVGYIDDYSEYPALIFSDTEDPELYHILQISRDDTQDEGNQLYLEYISKTVPSQESNNSNGPFYENYVFDDEADPEEYVWNENGVITNIELVDYTYDNDETYPCSVSALYIGHGGNLDNELGGGGGLERKSAGYMPANLAKVIIHNNSSGYNPELNSGINVYCCGFSEGDIILSGVAEWGKSYVMDFVGPYVEWRDAPNMVKIPEPPRPNFDNDDEGIK